MKSSKDKIIVQIGSKKSYIPVHDILEKGNQPICLVYYSLVSMLTKATYGKEKSSQLVVQGYLWWWQELLTLRL